MEMLMQSLQLKKVSRCHVGGDRTSLLPAQGRGVVRGSMSSTFTDIIVVDNEVMLNNGGSKLEVRVGGMSLGVVVGHKVGDDVRWKGMMPEKWGSST
jgi:hypothetical protein